MSLLTIAAPANVFVHDRRRKWQIAKLRQFLKRRQWSLVESQDGYLTFGSSLAFLCSRWQTSVFCSVDAHIRYMCTYFRVKVSLMRSLCKFVCFCVDMGASEWLKEWWSDFPSAASLWFHCCLSSYTVWFWLPPAWSSVLCVCVCVGLLCPGLFHMCLTLLWQGCPASQGRWRMSGTRAERRTASQHLMEWETHSLDG